MATTVPHVSQSRVVPFPIERVWATLRNGNFSFWKLVDKVDLQNSSENEVGGTRKIYYKDGAVQTFQIVELSDLKNKIVLELVESEPSVGVMSCLHIIKVKSVTHDNSTFVEWRTEYSSDADQAITQDSVFKRRDGLKDLHDYLSK